MAQARRTLAPAAGRACWSCLTTDAVVDPERLTSAPAGRAPRPGPASTGSTRDGCMSTNDTVTAARPAAPPASRPAAARLHPAALTQTLSPTSRLQLLRDAEGAGPRHRDHHRATRGERARGRRGVAAAIARSNLFKCRGVRAWTRTGGASSPRIGTTPRRRSTPTGPRRRDQRRLASAGPPSPGEPTRAAVDLERPRGHRWPSTCASPAAERRDRVDQRPDATPTSTRTAAYST